MHLFTFPQIVFNLSFFLTVRFRIILRRDQVHKIACNHCIDEKMELSPLATSDSALCWNAMDYSESQPEAAQFAVKFKVSFHLIFISLNMIFKN